MPGMTKEQGIEQVFSGGGHVVILGAGASIASTLRNSEPSGKKLPSMDNFIETLGLNDLLDEIPLTTRSNNFEKLYSTLHKIDPNSSVIKEIETRVRYYFENMSLPDEPTIYDYLVLSLRSKDLIATFNWDPFLYQAWCRSREVTNDLPYLAFLHGCVALGYSKEDKKCGPACMYARRDGGYFEPTRLLYPVEQKNYNDDEFIKHEWTRLKYWLSKESGTVRVTIFGYGAPTSDVEAVSLLKNAWGTSEERSMEQFEIIDITTEEKLRKRWDEFIHSHHYDITDEYFGSVLAFNPRRTSESYFCHYLPSSPSEAFRESNPIPSNFKTLQELWNWHKPLIDAEIKINAISKKIPINTNKKMLNKRYKKKGKTKKKTNQEITEYWLRRRRSKRTRIK